MCGSVGYVLTGVRSPCRWSCVSVQRRFLSISTIICFTSLAYHDDTYQFIRVRSREIFFRIRMYIYQRNQNHCTNIHKRPRKFSITSKLITTIHDWQNDKFSIPIQNEMLFHCPKTKIITVLLNVVQFTHESIEWVLCNSSNKLNGTTSFFRLYTTKIEKANRKQNEDNYICFAYRTSDITGFW